MTALERTHPGRAEYEAERTIGIHWGRGDVVDLVRAGRTAADLEALFAPDAAAFLERRRPYLLYE